MPDVQDPSPAAHPRQSVVLCLMLRDEADRVPRLLESCLGSVDAVALSDTGSADDTVRTATAWCEAHGLPLAVARRPWADFGHNRTLALIHAREAAATWKMDPARTWILILDGDQALGGTMPADLTEPAYLIEQRSGAIRWRNCRLIRADVDARYVGRTHEVLRLPDGVPVANLDAAWIDDIGDGGHKADKCTRDEALLRLDLADKPGDPRTLFYLAQTLLALGRPAEALAAYRQRIEGGGWPEEVWSARCRAGDCLMASADRPGAEAAYLAAWADRPWRAEPLAALAASMVARGDCARGCALAGACLTMPPPPAGDILFVDRGAWRRSPLLTLAVGAYHCGRTADGARACEDIATDPEFGPADSAQAQRCAPWYAPRIHAAVAPLPWTPPDGWRACNPSAVPCGDGLAVCVRTVNYTVRPDGSYDIPDPGTVQTRNWAYLCGWDLVPTGPAVELLTPHGGEPQARIRGCEDVRLVRADRDGYIGIATRCDMPGPTPRQVLCAWAPDGTPCGPSRPLSPPPATEKNWLPILGEPDNRLRVIYGHHPLTALRVPSSGPAEVASVTDTGHNLSAWRGGTAAVPWRGGLLYLVHEVAVLAGQTKRTYTHRLVWWVGGNPDHLRWSMPFVFRGLGIEFASGLAVRPDNALAILFGAEDREAWSATVTERDAAAMLCGRE